MLLSGFYNLFLTQIFVRIFYLNLKKIIDLRALHFSLIFLLFTIAGFSQEIEQNKIIIRHFDYGDKDPQIGPDIIVLRGNVSAEHDGMTLNCNKAYYFEKENYLKLFGDVHIVQKDTITMDSKYAEYNGANGFAYAQGDVVLTSPSSRLTTDTLKFDRFKNLVFYDSHATITNKGNILESKSGRYYTDEKKFQFFSAVTITTENKTIVKTNHLDFYEVPEHAYVFGPSTITNTDDFIYTENGFYDVKSDIGKLVKNSYIWYNKVKTEADSIYYSKLQDFASASYNVRITDTINKVVSTSHYSELYKDKDSIYMTIKPLVSRLMQEGDSVYLHAPIITLSGKENERIIRAYQGARILRDSMSGKADSIHTSELTGVTQLLGKPVLWSGKNQLTGTIMNLLSDVKTKQMDSLKVLGDAFIIEKDSLDRGFNQIKGVNLYGKFRDNKLDELDIIKNAEIIYFAYDEKKQFIGIDKGICSHINVMFEDSKIKTAKRMVAPTSILYPDGELPLNAQKLRGFVWRGDEMITSLKDIYSKEELEKEKEALKHTKAREKLYDQPMELQPETVDFVEDENEVSNLSDKNKSKENQVKEELEKLPVPLKKEKLEKEQKLQDLKQGK